MTSKITLITPPDIFENSNFSVLFMGMTEEEQEKVSEFFGKQEMNGEINFYVYQGESNVPWLLYALNRADVKYLNFNSNDAIINFMGSYILGRPNVYYTTENDNIKALMTYINAKHVSNVETFLEKVFYDKN